MRYNKPSRQVSQKVNNIVLGEHSRYRGYNNENAYERHGEGGMLFSDISRTPEGLYSRRSILRPNGDSGGDKLWDCKAL